MQATHQHLGLVTRAGHKSNTYTSAGQESRQAQQYMCCWLWPATAGCTHHTAFSTHWLQQVKSCKNKVRTHGAATICTTRACMQTCMQTHAASGPRVQHTTPAAPAVCLCQPTRPLKPADLTTRLRTETARRVLRGCLVERGVMWSCLASTSACCKIVMEPTGPAATGHSTDKHSCHVHSRTRHKHHADFWSISANLTQHMEWPENIAHVPHMAPAYHGRSTRPSSRRCTAPFHRRCDLLIEGRTPRSGSDA